MNEKSKTMKEIYESRYNPAKFVENPLLALEARGFLKCLTQFMPCENWIEAEDIMLLLTISAFAKKE